MMLRLRVMGWWLLGLGLFSGAELCAGEETPPNVIVILADDLAPGDLGINNGNRTRTPSLDRLATESVRFRQAMSASCVCAPARAALLTGRYPHRTGVVTLNMNRYPQLTRLRHDEITLAEVFRQNGYATGLVGKWHCGEGAKFHPITHGFDEFEGFSGSQDLSYFRYTLDVNGKAVAVTDDYLTDDLSRRAIDFVTRHQDKPFFLHLAHYAPHRPLEAPEPIVNRYRSAGFDESTATIYAMIEVMDRGIGELLDTLDRLKLSERTVIVFASDNGPDPLTGTRPNGVLRGTKYQVYQGGLRVPLFVRWPNTLHAGVRDQPVQFIDLFPTLVELCDLTHTNTPAVDGVSFVPLLRDPKAAWPHSRFWQWNRARPNYTHNAAMREGPWKLVRPFVTRRANPSDSEKTPKLYDLATDPGEQRDRSAEFPERVQRMNRHLSAWATEVEASRIRPRDPK